MKRWSRRKKNSSIRVIPSEGVLEQIRIVYINLDHREDRNKELLSEFERLGVPKPERMSAIKREFGGLGCSESHRLCMELELFPEHMALMVCEDDLEFQCTREELEEVVADFLANSALDVLCIGNATIEQPVKISGLLSIANNIQTASCYVVKPAGLPILWQAFDKSVNQLLAGKGWSRNANDQVWKEKQQGELFFAIPNRKLAKQRPSYSDIEERDVSYRS